MNLGLDLDGTVISCEPRQSAVLHAALKRTGCRADLKGVWEAKRSGMTTREALVAQGMAAAAIAGVMADWQRMIEDPAWLSFDALLPGVEAALEEMKGAGHSLHLVTSRSRPEWAMLEISRLGLRRYLHQVHVVAPAQAVRAKGEVITEAGLTAFFGDSEVDGAAAEAAGVPFFAVASGQRNASFLAEKGFMNVFSDLGEAWRAYHGQGTPAFSRPRLRKEGMP